MDADAELDIERLVEARDGQDGEDAQEGDGAAYLSLAFARDDAMAPPARLRLDGLERVVIGGLPHGPRGFDPKRNELVLADRFASRCHASLAYDAGRWVVRDGGSLNRTWLNGQPIACAVLRDGDCLELGHTVCCFSTSVARDGSGGMRWLDAAQRAWPAPGLETIDPGLEAVFAALARMARSELPILVLGETGTGKELAARAVHELSARRGPFIALNCGALSPTLLEAELFGHRKGAFSGAAAERAGWIRAAEQGTLFLDEIGDLPLAAQAAFLRVLQQREVVPLGDHRPVAVDFRLCAATHRDLEAMVARGEFRRDLYMRLQGHVVALPALRERSVDLGLLVGRLLRRLDAPAGLGLSRRALDALRRYDWPGNVRELEKCLASIVVMLRSEPAPRIELAHLPERVRAGRRAAAPPLAEASRITVAPGPPRDRRADDAQLRETLAQLLREHDGNISAIARATRKTRFQVRRWLKRFGLRDERPAS